MPAVSFTAIPAARRSDFYGKHMLIPNSHNSLSD
ncbi:MAG: hypothetical protein ACI9MS_003789, partial [Glaciecola sp.]